MKYNFLLLGLILAAGFGFAAYEVNRALPDPVLKQAPTFSTTTFNGTALTLDDFKEEPILLHFWATWCPPCIVELPLLVQLAKDTPETIFLTVAVKNSRKEIEKFLAKNKITPPDNFIIALDPDQTISKNLYGSDKLPETFLLNRDHDITRKIVGAQDNWIGPRWKTRLKALNQGE